MAMMGSDWNDTPESIQADRDVLKLSVTAISRALNELVESCTDANGSPKAPDRKVVAKCRGYLPAGYSMSFTKVKA